MKVNRTLSGFDCTKTSVFEHPFKTAHQHRGKIEEIRQLISLLTNPWEPPSLIERTRSNVHANDLRTLGGGRNSTNVVS
jgi:hypothetical protein